VTEQELAPEPGRVQVPPEENVPGLELVKVTVPPGRTPVPVPVSDTVAVQVVAEFTGTVDGEQLTLVALVRLVAVTSKVPKLPVWSASPP
jgi:hypothetical protein